MGNFLSSLGPWGAAIGGIQSIVGMFGAADAERRAREAAQQAILQFKTNASAAYNDTASAGQGNLYALSGKLAEHLQRQGGALGQALANAGVYNSSAAAGAIANQGQANAGALATEQTNLGNSLNQMKDQTGMEAAQMQFGLNQNNLNYARQQVAGAQGGISSFLASLGQMSSQKVAGTGNGAVGIGTKSPIHMGVPAWQGPISPAQGAGIVSGVRW